MSASENVLQHYKSLRERRWDIVREETARYRARVLEKMTTEEAYKEFLALYELGEAAIQNSDELIEKEAMTRIELTQKRQAMYLAQAARQEGR